MIGVYESPPPEGSTGIHYFKLDQATYEGYDSIVQRQVIRALVGATKVKDALHELFG